MSPLYPARKPARARRSRALTSGSTSTTAVEGAVVDIGHLQFKPGPGHWGCRWPGLLRHPTVGTPGRRLRWPTWRGPFPPTGFVTSPIGPSWAATRTPRSGSAYSLLPLVCWRASTTPRHRSWALRPVPIKSAECFEAGGVADIGWSRGRQASPFA